MGAGQSLLAVAIGFLSSVLSGLFGIGGGVVTTPAIRIILGREALIAVGTPLPVILPTAIAGAISYYRRGLMDLRSGLVIGAWGSLASIGGALATRYVGGTIIMYVTAGLIGYMSLDMVQLALRKTPAATPDLIALPAEPRRQVRHRWWGLAMLGLATGLYSGFLGLGGGFIVVPALVRWFGFEIKPAIGTSLVVVALLSIPGSITHTLLGHVDLGLAALLALGVVPGALIGAKITSIAGERSVKLAFACLLLLVGVSLALAEAGVL
ncbi:MAG: hypothetical protein CVT59_06100 [Actinobacteria bacterium HGW-Actinobacteria-1]|jgi:hypothetical protein|nr:MAG: hypothetical protein CVT59_06100 [Actinobacteria bacterium HGW-Actinobacteria-1]